MQQEERLRPALGQEKYSRDEGEGMSLLFCRHHGRSVAHEHREQWRRALQGGSLNLSAPARHAEPGTDARHDARGAAGCAPAKRCPDQWLSRHDADFHVSTLNISSGWLLCGKLWLDMAGPRAQVPDGHTLISINFHQ